MMSNIQVLSLILDFGLVVLIWMVQLIIYPNFNYHNQESLSKWHQTYTARIAGIVIPLMFGQLILYFYLVIMQPDTLIYIRSSLVLSIWILTFTIFVPLHKTINKGKNTPKTAQNLVNKNWSRTIIWTLIFALNSISLFY